MNIGVWIAVAIAISVALYFGVKAGKENNKK